MKNTGIILALLLASASFAQSGIVGKTITIKGKPIVMTTAQIMAREQAYGPKLPIRKIKDLERDQEVERENLPQNPKSPSTASWPPVVNDVPTKIGGNGTIGSTDGGKNGGPPLFSVPVNFGGPTLGESGFIPPDSDGDVSLSSIIVAANGRIKSYDRLGNLGTINTTTDNFFAGATPTGGTSDPRVVFDRITKRWFVEIIDLASTNNKVCLAVSNQEAINASTTWTYFSFAQNIAGGTSGFADYATLGVDANGVYVGTNRFGTTSFANCDLFAINKASLLAGTLTVTAFRNMISGSTGMFTPWPCTNDDPAATVAFVVGVDAGVFGSLDYRRVTFAGGAFTISANASLTVPTTSSPTAMAIPTSASTIGAVDSLDDRLFYARVCRNRLTGEVNVHTAHGIKTNASGVVGTNDRDSARWYNIGNVFSGTATLTASGTVVDGSASGFKFLTIPSTAMNGQGHQFIGFSMGNSTTSPGVAGAYRLAGDPAVTAPTLINAGVNYYAVQSTTSTQRWGDYSFTMVDPRDMMSIWSFQEYANANNSWQVRAFKVLAPAPTVTSLSPSSAIQGATTNVVITGTGIFDPDATYPDHLAVTFGPNITVNSVTWNSATQATVNISVSLSAALGSRTVTLTNPDGQTTTGSFTINPNPKPISGTMSLQGYTGSVAGLQFVYEIRDASTNALIETQTITGLGPSNSFSLSTTQPAGNYKLRIQGVNRFLARSQAISLTTTGQSGLSYAMTNGDADGNNVVGTTDFNILRAAWGGLSPNAPYNVAADFNGDGIIGTTDFNILRASWGTIGDN